MSTKDQVIASSTFYLVISHFTIDLIGVSLTKQEVCCFATVEIIETAPAVHKVRTGTSPEAIIPWSAFQSVAAVTAIEQVVTQFASKRIDAIFTVNHIGATPSLDCVIVVATIQNIRDRSSDDRIISPFAVGCVSAVSRFDLIVIFSTVKSVVSILSEQPIIT